MSTSFVILAAGQGTRLRPLTDDRPKCLVELRGEPLLDWQLRAARACELERLFVVGGYRAEQLPRPGLTLVRNPDFATTNMVASLFCAEPHFGDDLVVSYGDIAYEPGVLAELLRSPHDAAVVIDEDWRHYWERRFRDVLADAESLRLDGQGRIASIGQKVSDMAAIEGQYIGLFRLRRSALAAARTQHARLLGGVDPASVPGGRPLAMMYMTDFLQLLIHAGVAVWPVPIRGRWVEVDSLSDLELAETVVSLPDGALTIERRRAEGSAS